MLPTVSVRSCNEQLHCTYLVDLPVGDLIDLVVVLVAHAGTVGCLVNALVDALVDGVLHAGGLAASVAARAAALDLVLRDGK